MLRPRLVLVIALAGLAAALGPLLSRQFSPDVWVEAQHLQAAESFSRDGFLTHRLSPYIQLSPPEATPTPYRVYYTRTQQLSFLFWGVLDAIGLDQIGIWRLIALLLSMSGVVAFYAMLRSGGVFDDVASVAALLLASCPALVTYGHSFVLLYAAMPVLTYGSAALWLRSFHGRGDTTTTAALWLLLFLQGLATQHTYMVTTQLFFWTFAWIERRWSWRRAALWLTPHLVALAVLLAKNAWLLGGLDRAFVDIASKVLWRTANLSPGAEAASTAHPFEWLHLVGMVSRHLRWSGGALLLLFLLLALLLRVPALRGAFARPCGKLSIALLVPALVYWLVFFQEAYLHAFHSRNLMAGISLLAAIVAVRLWRTRKPVVVGVLIAAVAGQLAYSHHKAAEKDPGWLADARRLAALTAAEPGLLLCSFADDYPLSWSLGRPYVFPQAPGGGVNTHSWWLLRRISEVESVRRQVASSWPDHVLGLVVRRDHAGARPLRDEIEERGWRARWSSGSIDVYLVP